MKNFFNDDEKTSAIPFLTGDSGDSGDNHLEPAPLSGSLNQNLSPNPENGVGDSGDSNPIKPIEDGWVSPIPDDAPAVPSKLKRIIAKKETCLECHRWTYRNAHGQPSFFVQRFDGDDGKKQFRPLSLWRMGGKLEWLQKAPPEPRPLYNLHLLASQPDAPVVICEGEKAADAAPLLMPDCTTTTSLNGAQSPDKSDWSALAGRSVYIWPDNDPPGAKYAEKIQAIAAKQGFTVLGVLNNAVLFLLYRHLGLSTDAQADQLDDPQLPAGWDAADFTSAGVTAGAFAQALLAVQYQLVIDPAHDTPLMALCSQTKAQVEKAALAQAEAERQNAEQEAKAQERNMIFGDTPFAVVEWQEGYKNGVYFQRSEWLCSPLIIVAETRDTNQRNWGRLLLWHDNDRCEHVWACPMELLAGQDTAEFRRELIDRGLVISTDRDARQLLVDYVMNHKPESETRVRCVDKIGWHGQRYVLNSTQVFSGDKEEEGAEGVVYQGATNSDFSTRGTLEDWRHEVAARAIGNSRIVFAISCAFGGPLVEAANESGGGFNFMSLTSGGKTSSLMEPAASVWGCPTHFVKRWRTTVNGLEALCLSRNHSVLILDDLGQSNAHECGQAAYLIANGQSKARMHKEGGNRPLSTWNTLLLSSGEVDLAQHMADGGKVAKGGQVIRIPSIPADAGAGHGVLENLHDSVDGKHFSETMKVNTRKFYGTAGIAFLAHLVKEMPNIEQTIVQDIREIVTAMGLPERAAPEVGRVASRFALVAYAGELATKFGITGWPVGEAFKAAKKCFHDWLGNYGGGTIGMDEQALCSQIAAYLQMHGPARFPSKDDPPEVVARVQNCAGFTAIENSVTTYLVHTEVFRRELCKGFNYLDAVKLLIKKGWLVPGKQRAQQQVRVKGLQTENRPWFYVLTELAAGMN